MIGKWEGSEVAQAHVKVKAMVCWEMLNNLLSRRKKSLMVSLV